MHRFQFIVQFSVEDIDSFDQMIRIEHRLSSGLSPIHFLDGHDSGVGEINYFINTNDPLLCLSEVRSALAELELLGKANAGFRERLKGQYIRLWPAGDSRPIKVA